MAQTLSGKTVSTLIAEARIDLNATATPYFAGNDEFLDWFNEARFFVAKDGHALQTTENIDLVASTVEYTPVNDYIKIVAVQYLNASSEVKALKPGTPANVGHEYSVFEPAFYYEFDGKLGVYPTLSSVTTEKVKVFEITRAADLALDDAVDIPAIFEPAVKIYMDAKHKWKDSKWASSAQARQQFEMEMAKARLELSRVE